jgi:hypothetical protein
VKKSRGAGKRVRHLLFVFFSSSGLKNRATHSNLSPTFWPPITPHKIVSRPLPTLPTRTTQGPTRELSQGTGNFPLNPIFTGKTSVSRFLRKLKRDASRIRVTRPSPSLLARDLKSMSSRIRCDIKSDRSTPFTKRDPPIHAAANTQAERLMRVWRSFEHWPETTTQKSNQHGPMNWDTPEIPIILRVGIESWLNCELQIDLPARDFPTG